MEIGQFFFLFPKITTNNIYDSLGNEMAVRVKNN